ncbi:hypothetical protein V5P93_002128 [Actinokineospora auranticolor]|uniref:Integral membrane protein n=1 Tax=Actinokineospora auranticolor TaxID=155976 RepID=A0A2S6GDA5_9PSEU|nr:hypothetical protein [Actinokineospora auranticolor]PPK63228.1 hypothetical protein CLV40_13020 [Actinokineospora auranticolor]
MSDLVIAVGLCVVVAIVYAVAALIQARFAHMTVRELTRVPIWWVAQVLNASGAALHVVSLGFGPLSLIQPLGVLTLVIAVPVAALSAKRRVTRLELTGMACTVVGLAGLTLIISTSGKSAALGTGQLVGLLAVSAVLVVGLGVQGSRPGASPLWEATAGGLAFSVCSALCQTTVVHFGDRGLAILAEPVTILTIAAIGSYAIAATVLTQRSYRHGLGAPLAVTNLVNPASATLIGVVFLGEELGAGTVAITLAVACGITAALGVMQLARARDAHPDELPVQV